MVPALGVFIHAAVRPFVCPVGPTLLFHCPALVALSGARFHATLDGEPVAWHSSFRVAAGQTLAVGQVRQETRTQAHARAEPADQPADDNV